MDIWETYWRKYVNWCIPGSDIFCTEALQGNGTDISKYLLQPEDFRDHPSDHMRMREINFITEETEDIS